MAKEKVTISACADDKVVFPMSILENGKMVGIKFDILNKTKELLKNELDVTFDIEALPWKRCIDMTKSGKKDMLVLASYSDERAEFLDFPEKITDPKSPCKGEYVVTCNSRSILTPISNNTFKFTGDIHSIPKPVRMMLGSSMIDFFEKNGVKVETSTNYKTLLDKLLRDNTGSVMMNDFNVSHFKNVYPDFELKFHENKTKDLSKPSYYPFSKKTKISQKNKFKIWKAMAVVGQDQKYIDGLVAEYYKKGKNEEDGL